MQMLKQLPPQIGNNPRSHKSHQGQSSPIRKPFNNGDDGESCRPRSQDSKITLPDTFVNRSANYPGAGHTSKGGQYHQYDAEEKLLTNKYYIQKKLFDRIDFELEKIRDKKGKKSIPAVQEIINIISISQKTAPNSINIFNLP